MSKNTRMILMVTMGGVAAYLIYRNFLASNTNADMGGVDFGVLNPSSWN